MRINTLSQSLLISSVSDDMIHIILSIIYGPYRMEHIIWSI